MAGPVQLSSVDRAFFNREVFDEILQYSSSPSPLGVNKDWRARYRPLYYRHIVITACPQGALLLHALVRDREMQRYIRTIYWSGRDRDRCECLYKTPVLSALLVACGPTLRVLDLREFHAAYTILPLLAFCGGVLQRLTLTLECYNAVEMDSVGRLSDLKTLIVFAVRNAPHDCISDDLVHAPAPWRLPHLTSIELNGLHFDWKFLGTCRLNALEALTITSMTDGTCADFNRLIAFLSSRDRALQQLTLDGGFEDDPGEGVLHKLLRASWAKTVTLMWLPLYLTLASVRDDVETLRIKAHPYKRSPIKTLTTFLLSGRELHRAEKPLVLKLHKRLHREYELTPYSDDVLDSLMGLEKECGVKIRYGGIF